MSKKDATDLLQRYYAGNVTKEEKALVESWYLDYSQNAPTPDIDDQALDNKQQESLYKLLEEFRPKSNKYPWRYLAVAASVAVVLFTGILFLKAGKPNKRQLTVIQTHEKNDMLPGGNKAILILSNGSSIQLTDAKKGKLASEKGITIDKKADGQVTYAQGKTNSESLGNVFNTIITPRGGQYQLVLGDGTKVWLNSASSLKYPVTFTGTKREVELSGEAYFEVAHDRHKPFRVISNGQVVEVLGTHFNINSYSDEPMAKTTLLEGSVNVLSNGLTNTIKPGEQVQLKNGKMSVTNADLEEVMAWKNGFFYFKDADIKVVMRQLSRWYNVDIKYEGQIPVREFSGEISKSVDGSKLLNILNFEKITYHIENKTIIITP